MLCDAVKVCNNLPWTSQNQPLKLQGHKGAYHLHQTLLFSKCLDSAVPPEQFSHCSGAFGSSQRLGGNMLEVPPSIWGFRELPAKILELHILRKERYEICEKSIQWGRQISCNNVKFGPINVINSPPSQHCWCCIPGQSVFLVLMIGHHDCCFGVPYAS